MTKFAKTKIVATVGPACGTQSQLAELLEAGTDVFRLNMAHANRDEHFQRLTAIRAAAQQLGRVVAVLADLAGPKMRLGELPDGRFDCTAGARVRFVRGTQVRAPGELTTTYEPLVDELAVGDRVMLADGTVSLLVESRGPDYAECRVVQPGTIRSRQGVNLPGVKLSVQALSPIDRENALWVARQGIDFIGLSFVRTAEEVQQLKSLLAAADSAAQVIAKIEKPEALDHLEAIVEAADGVMVARGDLGVETDIARVALAQKQIVATCNRHRKPVIIATQMLDSMQHSAMPTRAEVTDVANAILDGADACMLSGETAVGEYPRAAVEMMNRIAQATESLPQHDPGEAAAGRCGAPRHPVTEATVHAAGHIAREVGAKVVVVATATGSTALIAAKHRNPVPTLGVSLSEPTLRRMCLYWGVYPLAGAPIDQGNEALLRFVVERGKKAGYLKSGDRLVLIAGTGLTVTAHNMVLVHELG